MVLASSERQSIQMCLRWSGVAFAPVLRGRAGRKGSRRLHHLEVIVVLIDEILHRLVGGLECGGKIAGLALKFGRLVGAMGKHQRRVDPRQMAL